MLEKIAIAYLRHKRVSVIIGFEVKTKSIYQLYNKCYLYNNKLEKVKFYDNNKLLFNIPNGKFNLKYTKED